MDPIALSCWLLPCSCSDKLASLGAEPNVLRGEQVPPLKWIAADEEGLVKFLVGEKSFNEDRVRKAVQRVNAAKSKSTQGESIPKSQLYPCHIEVLDTKV